MDDQEDKGAAENMPEEAVESAQQQTEKPVQPAPEHEKHHWWKGPRELMVAGLLVLVLAIGGVVVLSGSDNEGDDVASSEVMDEEETVVSLAAAVSVVEGNVQVSEDGETWTDATGGETVAVGQYVRTLADSRVVLLHDDGSAIRLDSDSQIQLSVSDSLSIEVMLVSGQVYSRVVESETRTFAVVTERERFEALGTAYKTGTNGETDDVEVYESSVKVDSDETMVDEGNKYDTETKEVSDIDLEKLADDEFVQWNKDQDESDEEFSKKLGVLNKEVKEEAEDEEPAPVEEPGPNAGITLSGSATDEGVQLNWSLTDVSSSDGFKIARSKTSSTPKYGVDTSNYVGNGSSTSKFLDLHDGKTYYFRICIYRAASGTCDTYSNAVQITTPEKQIEQVQAGAVTLAIDGQNLSWDFAGTAPHGFKVVLSSETGPFYPANSIQYTGSTEYTLPEKPEGTYYVRVCKYTADSKIDGGCTDYSNEVEYVVAGEGSE